MFRYMPEQASEVAPKIDWVNNLITDLSVFFTVAIVGVMIYFAIRYRRRGGVDHKTPQLHGNDFLEILWTVIPSIISVYVLYWGLRYYNEIRVIPKDAMTINVTGFKWGWNFEYENGRRTTNAFYVPVNRPIKLLMRSQDVLHSFFIPAMRVKKDVLPSQYSYLSFTPVKVGTYQSYCTEFCGTGHSSMLATLKVVPQADFDRWLNDKTDELLAARMTPVELGRKLYVEKGCKNCHSVDGSRVIGPSFAGLFENERVLTSGEKVYADEAYIERSIYDPNSQIVEGYTSGVMNVFAKEATGPDALPTTYVNGEELGHLVSFIRSLKEAEIAPEKTAPAPVVTEDSTPEERGEAVYASQLCVGCHSIDGSARVGPTFKGLYGKAGELTDGSSYTADAEYITKSVREPQSQIVSGFGGAAMPAYPESKISSEQLGDLIAYLKTLK